MPRISVIVPVYKTEKHLDRCVSSILAQTYTDFELILIDDGSPDNCPELCRKWAEADLRVHVIHQHNQGLSAARNSGIDWAFNNSDSDWISFVDSDDWIHPDMLRDLLESAAYYYVDISACGYYRTPGGEPSIRTEQRCPFQTTPEDFYLTDRVNAVVAWGKLYKKRCFEGIRYPVDKIHEDEFTTHKILFAQEQIAVIPAPLYYYYRNSFGITGDKTYVHTHKLESLNCQLEYFSENGYPKAKKKALLLLLDFIERSIASEASSKAYAVKLLERVLVRYKSDIPLERYDRLSKTAVPV